MAPEFYEQFPVHTNYLEVAYKFVMDDNFGLYHRILRVDKNVTWLIQLHNIDIVYIYYKMDNANTPNGYLSGLQANIEPAALEVLTRSIAGSERPTRSAQPLHWIILTGWHARSLIS